MKIQSLMKISLLVVLGATSWFCTSTLIAQGKRARPNPGFSDTPGFTKTKKTDQDVALSGVPVKVTSSFHFDEMTLTAAPGGVTVDAKVTIEDSRKNKSYVWSLLIKNRDTGQLVSSTDYDNQVFSVKPGIVTTPTFKDDFKLPSGTYNVELRLYDVVPDLDLAKLRDADVSHPLVVLADNKDITLVQ